MFISELVIYFFSWFYVVFSNFIVFELLLIFDFSCFVMLVCAGFSEELLSLEAIRFQSWFCNVWVKKHHHSKKCVNQTSLPSNTISDCHHQIFFCKGITLVSSGFLRFFQEIFEIQSIFSSFSSRKMFWYSLSIFGFIVFFKCFFFCFQTLNRLLICSFTFVLALIRFTLTAFSSISKISRDFIFFYIFQVNDQFCFSGSALINSKIFSFRLLVFHFVEFISMKF